MAECIPGFFKVYLPEKSSNRLHIPGAFIAHLSPSKPEKVMLINHIGEYWHVNVAYCDKGVFFLDGWQKFVKDNSLETADILVLKYDGDCWFNVKIMGKSGIEKTESYKQDLWVEDEEEETEEEEKGGEEAEEDCKDDSVFEVGDNDSAADKDYIEEEDDDDEMTAITSCRGRINIGKSKKRAVAKAGGSKAVYDINLLEVDVGDYGLYPNPYFVSKAWAGTRKNYLHVPSHVLKDLGLKLAKKITILDERGYSFHGQLDIWKDGRQGIKGWSAFCRAKKLKKDDICICEFTHSRKMQNTIKVHIVQGVGSQSKAKRSSSKK